MWAAMIRQAGEAVSNPFFVCMLIVAISVASLWLRGNTRAVRWGLLGSVLSLWIISTPWVPGKLVQWLEAPYPVVDSPQLRVHWIVVLGGGHHDETDRLPANDALSLASVHRLVEGVRLYQQMPNSTLIVSGGAGRRGGVSEAAYLAEIAQWFGIPKQNIVLETVSFNTAEEALAIKPIVKHDPFYLVTSALHMRRALALCQRQGLQPIAAPTSHSYYGERIPKWEWILPNAGHLASMSAAWHEVLGMVFERIRGDI